VGKREQQTHDETKIQQVITMATGTLSYYVARFYCLARYSLQLQTFVYFFDVFVVVHRLSFVITYFGSEQIIGPFEIQNAKGGMYDWCDKFKVEIGTTFERAFPPHFDQMDQYNRVQDDPDTNPRNVKTDRDQLDTNRHKTQVNNPGRKALLVKDSPGN
jgi:hypothetical protein